MKTENELNRALHGGAVRGAREYSKFIASPLEPRLSSCLSYIAPPGVDDDRVARFRS